MKMKASLKGKYASDKGTASGSIAVNAAGDANLRATFTDSTISLSKPGSFTIDYNVPKNGFLFYRLFLQDFRFQFMNTMRVFKKPVIFSYTHFYRANRTALDGSMCFNTANRVSASCDSNGGAKVRYVYKHRGGRTTFEPSYDFKKDSLEFAVSQMIRSEGVVRASYQTSSKVLEIDWFRGSKLSPSFPGFGILQSGRATKVSKSNS
ncbi:hypothetical protein QJS04_geneDACA011669 [Acorus gramineus]|uniref:Uncharacterized protein n=1 Tax=Acorus gramineus TaxID=55184 RepID=A0AAV9BJ23_ACOGR|nr:hypothetical protein QJS04_geneDACA011669 [Acorus gramineus]